MGRAEVSFLYLADFFPFFPTMTKEHGPRLHLLKNCKSPVKAIAGNESYLHNSEYFRHFWFFACLETEECDIFYECGYILNYYRTVSKQNLRTHKKVWTNSDPYPGVSVGGSLIGGRNVGVSVCHVLQVVS